MGKLRHGAHRRGAAVVWIIVVMLVAGAVGFLLWSKSSGNFAPDTRALIDKLEKVDLAVAGGVRRADYVAVAGPLRGASEDYILKYGSAYSGDPTVQAIKIACTSYQSVLKHWQQNDSIAGNLLILTEKNPVIDYSYSWWRAHAAIELANALSKHDTVAAPRNQGPASQLIGHWVSGATEMYFGPVSAGAQGWTITKKGSEYKVGTFDLGEVKGETVSIGLHGAYHEQAIASIATVSSDGQRFDDKASGMSFKRVDDTTVPLTK